MPHIAIIHEREFIKSGEPTYKITRAKHTIRNPKGSEIIRFFKVNNVELIEKKIVRKLKENFTQMIDYGYKYYQGDINEMINICLYVIKTTFIKLNDMSTFYKNTYIEKIIVFNKEQISGVILFKNCVLWETFSGENELKKYTKKYSRKDIIRLCYSKSKPYQLDKNEFIVIDDGTPYIINFSTKEIILVKKNDIITYDLITYNSNIMTKFKKIEL